MESDEHLRRCLVYLDLNMVRAGVVDHPAQWEMNGYNEILQPPARYGVIDQLELTRLCGFTDAARFQEEYGRWVEVALGGNLQRESCWAESVAVGSRGFIEETKARLGILALGRGIHEQRDAQFVLRERPAAYTAGFAPENAPLSSENTYFLDMTPVITDG